MPNTIIYFEAQTGIIRDQPSAASSFYQYAIQVRHRAELEEAIAAATAGSSELQYTPAIRSATAFIAALILGAAPTAILLHAQPSSTTGPQGNWKYEKRLVTSPRSTS